MGIEIEKKYRLSVDEQARVRKRLDETGAELIGEDFEENTLYAGGALEPRRTVLRLRCTDRATTLTYKERFASDSTIKRQREDETQVEDADAMRAILDALGYRPALVYEKRRETWQAMNAEIVVDELPFGYFVEIEGDEEAIEKAETLLELSNSEACMESYPELTERYGTRRNNFIEARFPVKTKENLSA